MIIVLCGVRGSGKDTIGDILRDQHGFTKEAFANPLKAMVKHAFPAFTDEDLYGPSKNREREYEQYPLTGCPWCGGRVLKKGNRTIDGMVRGHQECEHRPEHFVPEHVSPRIALQTLGTEWGRRLYNDVWIDACFERIKQYDIKYPVPAFEPLLPKPRNWVITDGRFLNETRRSRELGGIAVKLTRGLWESTDTHPSEAELRTIPDHAFDYIFDNASLDLEGLPAAVAAMLMHLYIHKKDADGRSV